MMLQYLSQPLPYKYNEENLKKLALFVSGIVFLFLLLFRPVGITKGIQVDLVWACLIHGLVGGLLFLLHYSIISRFVTKASWNRAREIVMFLCLVVIAGGVNFGIGHFINSDYNGFEMHKLLRDIYNTLLVASVPMGMTWWKLHQEHISQDNSMTPDLSKADNRHVADQSCLLTFPQDEPLHIDTTRIMYIQAQGNYIELLEKCGHGYQKHVRRCTMKHIEEQLARHASIVKTHRSYLVNLQWVNSYTGNASGLQLEISGTDLTVPVSRARVNQVQQLLE